jgi:hypothetical protein
MRTIFVLLCTALVAGPAGAAEDYRVMKLEQDMRTLERHVQTLQRQLLEVQQQARRADPNFSTDDSRRSNTDDTEPKWLVAAAWNRVKPGMSEFQVIEILGKPTALRPDAAGRRALLYTLEIGTTGFLTGTISFERGTVIEVQTPTLR